MKSSNRIPRHDWKNHTKFVTLNATFRILKVNATGNGHRGCIYFENLHHFKIMDVFKKTVEIHRKKRYNNQGSSHGPQAEIAQLVEHFTRNEGVVGSSPIFSFRKKGRKPGVFKGVRLF